MPGKKKSGKGRKRAPKGNAAGVAAIRIMCNTIENRMIQRYIGNAPTLDKILLIAKAAIKRIGGIRPAMVSDCDHGYAHQNQCECVPIF